MTISIQPRPGAFMLNPLEVEQRYQDLLLLLSLPTTPFQRLSGMRDFLSSLGAEAAAYESHVLECAERLPVHCAGLQAAGHPPHQLESIGDVMRETFRHVPAAHSVPGVADALRKLQVLSVLAYAYSGAWEDVRRTVGDDGAEGSPRADQPGSFGEGLRRVEEALPPGADDSRALLAEVRREALNEAESPPHAVWLPVIEQASNESAPRTGSLRRVRAAIFGDRADGHDSITSDAAVFGVQHAGSSLADVPMKAVRGWLARRPGGHADRRYAGQVSFDGSYALHAGVSSDLAMAAVLACAILDMRAARVRYRLRPDVALTGVLEEDGTVRPVDVPSLALKVEAVFHSPAKVLVVPRTQTDDAEHAVRALQERYPRRVLEIIGVRSFGDLFYDLRVIDLVRAPLAVHAVRSLWRRRSHFVAVVSTTLLALLAVWYGFGRMDQHPDSVEYEGTFMKVLNRYGTTLSEIEVGAASVILGKALADLSSPQQSHALVDLDGDGVRDVVHVVSNGKTYADGFTLQARSIARDSVLWITPLEADFTFPEKPEAQNGGFSLSDIVTSGSLLLGSPRIYVAAIHTPSFPGIVMEIDGCSGVVTQQYIHPGHVSDLLLADLEGDGSDELIVCGSNNAYDRAFLAVLEPAFLDGSGPAVSPYACEFPGRAAERYYALLPRSLLHTALPSTSPRNQAKMVMMNNARREVTVTVEEPVDLDGAGTRLVPPVLNYVFSSALRPLTVSPGDSYHVAARYAVEKGIVAIQPDTRYFEALKGEITVIIPQSKPPEW